MSDAKEVMRSQTPEELLWISKKVRAENEQFPAELVADLIEYVAELKREQQASYLHFDGFIN